MKKLLFVNSCISTNKPSRTKLLCDAYLERFDQAEWDIEEVVLEQLPLSPFTPEMLQARNDCVARRDFSDDCFALARAFANVDFIVIGAPYWDLSFPSWLKLYIEHIMVTYLTFAYTASGVHGLCKAEKLVYITTVGGYIQDEDWGYGYIRGIAHMLGITDTQQFTAQGLDIVGMDAQAILANALEQVRRG
jgi:FMN-dependent NADH-azoreductase